MPVRERKTRHTENQRVIAPIGSRFLRRRARRRSLRPSDCPGPPPKCCSHSYCRHRRCRSGRTICSGQTGRMPVNSGSPIIGRLASAGLGFLSSTCGLPGDGIDRVPQPDNDAANSPAAFADTYLGVAGLRQPDTRHLAAGLCFRGRCAQQCRQNRKDQAKSASHGALPWETCLHSNKSGLCNATLLGAWNSPVADDRTLARHLTSHQGRPHRSMTPRGGMRLRW